jgi:hypothetical protein
MLALEEAAEATTLQRVCSVYVDLVNLPFDSAV